MDDNSRLDCSDMPGGENNPTTIHQPPLPIPAAHFAANKAVDQTVHEAIAPEIAAQESPPTPRTPIKAQSFKFMSNFKKIVDAVEGHKPKDSVQALARKTKISYRLMMGFYTGKFTPSVKEACWIAQQFGVSVEGIWYLLPVASPPDKKS